MKVPKLMLAAALIVPSCLCLPGCGPVVRLEGSGTIVTDTPSIEDFTRIDAGHSFEITVTAGPAFKVEILADDNVVPHLDVKKSGDTLDLGLKDGIYNLKNVTLKAAITLPKLHGIDLSGASKASISGFDSQDTVHVELSGASSLSGDLVCGDADFDLSGASSAELRGSGKRLDVDLSGASSAKLFNFAATDAKVDASGASKVSINLSGNLNADASGASKVIYTGNPDLGSVDTSGGASIRAK